MVQLNQRDLMPREGVMTMNFVIISCKNFRFHLRREIRNWSLTTIFRHYKNKRPPPTPAQMFDRPIAVRLSHFYHIIIFFREMIA